MVVQFLHGSVSFVALRAIANFKNVISCRNLNGLYKQKDDQHQTMNWYRFRKDYQGLKEATMMIREKLDIN